MSSNLGDEVVILDHKKGFYYSLDNVGQMVWDYIQKQTTTLDELVVLVEEKYDVKVEILRTDIQELLDDLLKEKLIEIV